MSFGFVLIVALGVFIAPRMKGFNTVQPSVTVVTVSPTVTLPPTAASTATLLSTPTAVPFAWKRISLGQEFERDSLTAFATDEKDPDVIYAAMKNAGVYKTIDGGLSWRPAHFGLASAQVESLWIDSQNPQILYAGTLGGVFKTEDGGDHWRKDWRWDLSVDGFAKQFPFVRARGPSTFLGSLYPNGQESSNAGRTVAQG